MGSNRKSQDGSIKRIGDFKGLKTVESVEPILAEVTPESKISLVAVRSIYPAHLKYRGAVSGQGYEWMKAGDIASVRQEDVQSLLDKRIGGTGCCGAYRPDGTRLFELV